MGSWKERPDALPLVKEVESWAKAVWRLKGGLMVAFLNNDLLIFEFEDAEEANYALEGGCRTFWGGRLNLERWNPDFGCVKRKNQLNKVWVRIVGLPLHLWTCDVLRMIGDGCGGYLVTDEETIRRTDVLWARILVKAEGRERPSTINILAGSRSYELQIWWELPPWVAEVFPSKGADIGMQNQEEDEWSLCVVQGACSGRKQGIDDDLKRLSAVGNEKSDLGLVDHTKGVGRTGLEYRGRAVIQLVRGTIVKGLVQLGGKSVWFLG